MGDVFLAETAGFAVGNGAGIGFALELNVGPEFWLFAGVDAEVNAGVVPEGGAEPASGFAAKAVEKAQANPAKTKIFRASDIVLVLSNAHKVVILYSMQNQAARRNKKKSYAPLGEVRALLAWYHGQKRDLPWRRSRDPYPIWLSETMLQQTTTTAVIPYFEKFLRNFPTLKSLALADEPDVLALWAGLGYYSRARNLLKAARELATFKRFPQTFSELIELPGFGPYTARAVSSIAFDEPVGVLDGNVIRVLTRRFALKLNWWQPVEREKLQAIADAIAQPGPSSEINQALMELGSQVCTPQNPHCFSCPWVTSCEAKRKNLIAQLPMRKPKRASEIWLWRARIETRKNTVKLILNKTGPFLKNAWVLPGKIERLEKKPNKFDFRHSITHHDIFIELKGAQLSKSRTQNPAPQDTLWLPVDNLEEALPKVSPSSLIRKALHLASRNGLLTVGFTMLIAMSLISCRSSGLKNTPGENISSVKQIAPGLTQLTSNGENYRPQLSPDGQRILFISAQRANHIHAQIYEFNLATNKERRISYQDGTIYDAVYDQTPDHILYSSNTDEIKENPIFIRQALFRAKNNSQQNNPTVSATPSPNAWPPFLDETFGDNFVEKLPQTDIYYGSHDGREIKRLTTLPGFEGQLSLRPRSHEAIIVASDGIKNHVPLHLSRLNFQNGALSTLSAAGAVPPQGATLPVAELWPQVSPDGKKLLWSHLLSSTESEIWVANLTGSSQLGQAKKLIAVAGAHALFAKWSPKGDEIVFASNHDEVRNFEIYVAKSDGSCVRRLTTEFGQDVDPIFSPDQKTLYFASDRTGRRQIYALVYNPAPCAATGSPVQ